MFRVQWIWLAGMKLLKLALPFVLILSTSACYALAAPLSTPPVGATPPTVQAEYVPTVASATPTFAGCAYVWGSQDLPEVSRRLNADLQKMASGVSGLAYAYGENCVYADGHQTFSAMETDFRVGIQVRSIKDEDDLGNWIFQVMQAILALPADQLSGPQPGRVDFDFKQPDPGELFVTVPIDQYRRQPPELKGARLFRVFYSNP